MLMIKLLRNLKPFRLAIAAVLILVFLQTMADLYLPTLLSDIVDIGIVQGDIPYIWRVGTIMLLIAGIGMLVSMGASYLASRTAVGFGKMLRSKVFVRVESLSFNEFDQLGTATLITRTTNDINQIQILVFMMQRMMLGAPIMCIGGVIMAVSMDPPLSLIFVASIPLLTGVIWLVMTRAFPLFRLMQLKIDRLNLVVRENLTGIRVVRAYNRSDQEIARFQMANRDLADNAIRVNKLMASLMPAMMLIMDYTLIAVIWFGSIRINQGNMQVGALMAFIQYAMQIMMSLVMLSMMFIMVPRASASAARINEVLDMEPDLVDRADAEAAPPGSGRLAFENVGFSFPGAERHALQDISFNTRPGEVTAIIGGTGSGKSALVGLIPRFYDVNQGRITIDGIDIRTMTLKSLRARIGFVPQKNLLFSGSIADNIRLGKEGASDDDIRIAAENAQAMDFIAEMADGFDTMIEQGGANVSGGQKQRIAIARALVRRAEIYIFDDSFSALDFKTDSRLRAALKRETEKATVIMVAQRAAAVLDADQIIVLDEGRMVGRGTHRELLQECEVYREILFSQMTEEELA